jgi:hypothetical protein
LGGGDGDDAAASTQIDDPGAHHCGRPFQCVGQQLGILLWYIDAPSGDHEFTQGGVVGRVPKAAGLPGFPPGHRRTRGGGFLRTATPATPWDVLLAWAGAGLLTRVLLRPVTSWAGASLSRLMPLGYQGGLWWVRARLASDIEAAGGSFDTITDRVSHGGLDFDRTGQRRRRLSGVAQLTLDGIIPTDDPSQDVAFDPTRHSAPGVSVLAGWLTDIRRRACSRGRRGRDAG